MPRGKFSATLDRIEDGRAVLLPAGGESVEISLPVRFLPEGAKEGEVFIVAIRRESGDAEEEAQRLIESLGRHRRIP
ncbi:DUF3006 domain-containing protein [Methanoculleus sp. FWC-SCC1]|uniref:DUF3006 domain-containing protein n=1 Tax=Methanoculleus frigidifontis TaxID=2584085 RepID=A0ABT8M7B5_9EURY|nr:DUF3006 domain-containing protein [Methanoculleus sp. FWC-SCC1]MDN7023822.1 DUF3006 domain-containing protein [Methanoculleus sp. FWC-SCC1]